MRLEFGESGSRHGRELEHVGQRLPVLPAEVGQELAPLADGGQPNGVFLDGLGRRPEVDADIGHFDLKAAQSCFERGQRRPGAERSDSPPDDVGGAPVVEQEIMGFDGCSPGLVGVGQPLLFSPQDGLFSRVVESGPVEFVELVAQEVDLAGPGAGVAPQRGHDGVDLANAPAGLLQRLEVDVGVCVECRALHRRSQQRLMRVLSVEVDQSVARLGQ